MSLSVDGVTFYPDPLIFYAATLKGAMNAAGANALVRWLQGEHAQALLQANGFAAQDGARTLTV